MMTNGACYIRVSTDEQAEYSPAAQLRLLKEYAANNDISLADEHIFMDEGVSGRKADKRPAFMRMIAKAKTKPRPFDVILVHKFDRFARSREDSVVYKSLLKKEAGIKVVSITESTTDDKFSVILEAMLEAMAEYYSLNLADEVKKGMTEKARRGELQSAPPFGYRAELGRLAIVPEEAAFVRFIFEQTAGAEMSMRRLALYMNDLGVKTHRANKFEARTIEYILNNPVYIGKLRWTPTGRARRDFNHPDTIVTDGAHEPIISPELWQKAHRIIRRNKALHKPRTRRDAPIRTWLKGLVRCGMCGMILTGGKNGFFQCNGYSNGICTPSSGISIKKLEGAVLEQLQNTLTDTFEINIAPVTPKTSERELLTSKLKKLDYREGRMISAYQNGIDSLDEYRANKNKLSDERQALLQKLDELATANDHIPAHNWSGTLHDLLTDDTIPIDIKFSAAHTLITRITFTKPINQLQITYSETGFAL